MSNLKNNNSQYDISWLEDKDLDNTIAKRHHLLTSDELRTLRNPNSLAAQKILELFKE